VRLLGVSCLHSRKRLNASPNSACPFRLCFVACRDRQLDSQDVVH
jgi:hypothetical protein